MRRDAATDWHGVGLLAVLGVGDDDLVGRVLADRPTVRRILVLDPAQDAAGRVAAGKAGDRVRVIAGLRGPALAAALHGILRQVPWLRYLRTLSVAPPAGAPSPAAAQWFAEAVGALRSSAVSAAEYYGNDPADALDGLRHVLGNLDVIARSGDLAPWRGALAGRPAVVASAGPSLPAAYDALRAHQDRFLLVAPDTSLKPLLAAGIRPHIVTSKERSERTTPLLAGVDARGVTLVALPLLPPAALRGFTGDVVTVYSGAAHFPWLGRIGLPRDVLPFDGSAGNMAFRVCEALGCDPVILVGQDLCFAADGGTHVPGAENAQARAIHRAQPRLQVPGNRGGFVETTPTWAEFLRVYEEDLGRWPGRCLNATAGGALIRGATPADLARALATAGPAYDPRRALTSLGTRPAQNVDLPDAVERSALQAGAMAALCDGGAGRARAVAATAWDGSGGPWDVDALLAGPHRQIAAARAAVVRHDLFHELITPVAQSSALQAEMAIYGLQRACATAAELHGRAALAWAAWFDLVGALCRTTAAVLRGGGA